MRIGAFINQSLIDWPGRIAAVIFTKGCNLRCTFCHNQSLVYPEKYNSTPDLPVEEILQNIERRKNWLDGVVISGGEPTIQKSLFDFLKSLKLINIPAKLDTNGTNPKMLKKIIEHQLVDAIAMDIKTELCPEKYQNICNSSVNLSLIRQSVEIIQSSNVEHYFRTTIIPKIHTDSTIE
ncbi:MAG TPA: anaerobic ribonucleoside-triphosphate reductase activating protein, partial [Salinivirgaceae bacterium]|nr:anaerobic ribonucleoside-triphosphate reductase activating protein [Salinivirgaceae bacterium]